MINITIEYNLSVMKTDIKLIPSEQGGVYVFYGPLDEVLYVGKSTNLKTRITNHFKSSDTVTSYFSHNFYKCSIIFDNDLANQDIYETYLINSKKPKFNALKTYNYKDDDFKKHPHLVSDHKVRDEIHRCTATKKDGKRCGSLTAIDGLCAIHRILLNEEAS